MSDASHRSSPVPADALPAEDDGRIGWVDYAKGICMVGVVTLYAVNKMNHGGDGGWMQAWADFARPFRMPDFFLLSGLFLSRVIDRPWRSYLDKKIIHYLYFFILWSTLFFMARFLALRMGLFHGREDAGPLWYKLIEPYAMLWFIQLLPIFFLVTRFLKRIPAWILLPAAALLQMFPLAWSKWTLVLHFSERYVYFLIGYYFAAHLFRLARWGQAHRALALAGILAWAWVNWHLVRTGLAEQPGISLALGVAGAVGVILTASQLAELPGVTWLRYLGRHSLVIYVGFYLPMLTAIALIQRTGVPLGFSAASALVSILSALTALALFWATRNTLLKGLFVRPAWARIPISRDT